MGANAWNFDYIAKLDAIGLALGTDISAIGADMNFNDRTLAKLDAIQVAAAAISTDLSSLAGIWNGELLPGTPETGSTRFQGLALPSPWVEWDEGANLTITVSDAVKLVQANLLANACAGAVAPIPAFSVYRVSMRATIGMRENNGNCQLGCIVGENLISSPATANFVSALIEVLPERVQTQLQWWADYATYTGGGSNEERALPPGAYVYIGLAVDSADTGTIYPMWSPDGLTWVDFDIAYNFAGVGLSGAPTHMGFYVNNSNPGQSTIRSIIALSWRRFRHSSATST